jgi:hypothetical protein
VEDASQTLTQWMSVQAKVWHRSSHEPLCFVRPSHVLHMCAPLALLA